MERTNKIKKFLCTNALFVIGGVFSVAGIVAGIAVLADGSSGGIILLLCSVIGLFLIALELKGRINLNNWLKKAEETNKLESVINDFENGNLFFENNLHMGEAYIFMSRMGKIYEYGDIKGVSLKSSITRLMCNSQLHFKTSNGKKPFVSCSLPLETVEREYADIVEQIQKHNLNVKIGKHKKVYN